MINLNSAVLVGRITKDPELRKTQSNTSVTQFTIAVNRRYKQEGQDKPEADFISCVAWRQSADYLCQYGRKGDIVSVEGRIQTRNYDGQNGKVYVTELVADNVQLISKEARPGYVTDNDAPPEYKAEQSGYTKDESGNFGGAVYDSGASVHIEQDDLPFY